MPGSYPTYSIKEIANWILDFAEREGVGLTNMALNKLAFFAYEYALVHHDRKLTKAKIEAWDHGPVFREIYSAFKTCGANPIRDRATKYDPNTDRVDKVRPTLASDDEQIMIKALEPLIRLPAYILREISHDSHGAWSKVWHHKMPSNPGMEISDDLILASAKDGARI